MELSNISSKLKRTVEKLSEMNRDNIIVADDNIVLYSLNDYDKNRKVKTFRTYRMKQYTVGETSRFLVFNKDGILFNEEIDLFAQLIDSDGELLGYVFKLADIKVKKTAEDDILDTSISNGIIIYTKEDNEKFDEDTAYFIGNDIDNELLENSLCDIDTNLTVKSIGNMYIMNYKGKKYKFSSGSMITNLKDRHFFNIGKFTEM